MLIDTHAHLVSLEDVEGAVNRAYEAGVAKIISVSTGLDSSYATIEIANVYESVFAAVGIHPHSASQYTEETFSKIEDTVLEKRVVAVGETGLDYHYMNSPKEIQIESFRAHINMATRFTLPFIVHVREADEDMLSILRESDLKKNPGVIHCFSGNYEMAKQYLELGFFISFSGIVTFNRAADIREAAKKIPFDRILIETDSPYLAPVPLRGKKNEPANVKYIAQVVAEARGIDTKTLQEQLLKNTLELFPKIEQC